jgi:hypothetical protein
MSTYTDEEKAAIMAEAERCRRPNYARAALPPKEKQAVMQWLRNSAGADPAESENDRAWNDWCDTRIAAALREERAGVIPALRDAVDELFIEERAKYKALLRESTRVLELQTARLESALNVVQNLLAIERNGGAEVVELPNKSLLKSVN